MGVDFRRLSHWIAQENLWKNSLLTLFAITLAMAADQCSGTRALEDWQKNHRVNETFVPQLFESYSFKICNDPKLGHSLLKSFLRENAFPSTGTFAFDITSRVHLLWFRPDQSAPRLYSTHCFTPRKKRKKSGEPPPLPPNFKTIASPFSRTPVTWTQIETLIEELERNPKADLRPISQKTTKISPYEIAY